MKLSFWARLCGFAPALVILFSLPASAYRLDPGFHRKLLGPVQAKGVIVWSHGRSIDSEDSKSPTPPYLGVLRDAGWDVLRFDRWRDEDTLPDSTRALVERAAQLKRSGYRRVVLAGQSFGAFLSLMAADASDNVDAVVATAPAAYGDFQDFYNSWRLNATRLYPLIKRVKRARVMLFFFHDDDFDPGGRGVEARAILSGRGLGYAIVDQPAYLTGHWASSTGLFLRRFGGCIEKFAADDRLKGELTCNPVWGEEPSADLRLPNDLMSKPPAPPTKVAAAGASRPDTPEGKISRGAGAHQIWYGFYPNGREVIVAIKRMHGKKVDAVYAIGPGIDENEPAEWSQRSGTLRGDEMVFAQKGLSTLRCRLRTEGGLSVTWISPHEDISMDAALRQINPDRFVRILAQK